MTTARDLPVHHDLRRRHRCRCRLCLPIALCLILVLVILAVILAVTVFKSRQPTTKLVSATVSGVSPRVTMPAVQISLNITLDLEMAVYNPNRASFAHADGKTQLYYRGTQVGDADVAAGRIPSRGSEQMHVRMTVEADRVAQELESLLGDVMAGEVGLDTTTRIPGRVTFLGFIKHHAVATSQCHVAIGFPDLKVKSQECTQKTKL